MSGGALRPRRVLLRALAKINLDLRVLGRRSDGYHELRTIFQTISLADRLEITFTPARKTAITLDDPLGIPANLATLAAPLPWLIPVTLFLVLPCALASTWGPRHIDPAVVGILFMTEITVGGITAALMAGEPFGLRELAGVLLISGAALVDSLWDFRQARKAAGAVERTRTSTVLPTSTSS